MCKQCPTVGDFICWIFRCGRCENSCKEVSCKCDKCNKCDCYHQHDHCERKEKCIECICREKKEPVCCPKVEKEHGCNNCDCNCESKFY